MDKKTSIGISLHVGNQIIDLQIPKQVSIKRLKELLEESLQLIQIILPEKFELLVANKPIYLKEDSLIADFPFGDGDQLVVKELIENDGGKMT